MKRKRHGTEVIIRKLREAEVLEGRGQTVGQVCQQLEISEQTLHRRRSLSMNTKITASMAVSSVLVLSRLASAQPAQFTDLGAHLAPESLRIPVQLQSGNDIQWFRIELPEATNDDGFVDVWSDPPDERQTCRPPNYPIDEIEMYVYDPAGERFSGSFRPIGLEGIVRLSFGLATDNRPPICLFVGGDTDPPYYCTFPFAGQEGPMSAGIYWFAVGHRIYPRLHNWEILTDANPASLGRCAHLNFVIQPAGVPYCDSDMNWDGNADAGDIDYLINVIAGGENLTGRNPDFNHDGNVDQGDIDALINYTAGGACP